MAMNMTTWLRKMGWRHLIGIIAAVYALVPLVWVLDASLSGLSNLSTSSIIPAHMSLINYRKLLSDPNYPYLTWYKNTMMVAGIAAILQVMIAASAAYAFSRLRFRGRRVSLLGILVIQMFPQLLALVALYLFMFQIHFG
jgi:arabinogalactan oligomer/maltooligosaccharide transport system permease protein